MKSITLIGLVLAILVVSSDAKLFKKKKWLHKIVGKPLGLGHGGDSVPAAWEEHPKIVEIVKHVPVIQKVEVIKPVEIIKIVHVPVEVIKEIEVIKHVPIIQEVIKEIEVIKTVEYPVEVIKEIEVLKEIPVIKTVEIPKPYEVIKHIPIIKTIEIEKPVIQKVPVAHISHYTKEISLPKLSIPSFSNIKSSLHSAAEQPQQYESVRYESH